MIAMAVASLAMLLRALKLPTVARHTDEVEQLAEREGWTFVRYLHHLVELEVHERRRRRIARNLKDSELPPDKTLATLDRARLPAKVARTLPALCEGAFVERGDNLLAFGLPGRGKTHLVCAIGHELIQRGYRVLFTATYALVQRLLVAKRDLRLEQELAVLDRFDAVLLDDIGYVQQSRDEMLQRRLKPDPIRAGSEIHCSAREEPGGGGILIHHGRGTALQIGPASLSALPGTALEIRTTVRSSAPESSAPPSVRSADVRG